jgi:branched-chain amino acid transport system permease protein
VFGVMDMINLAHGSLYMVGAFLAAWLVGLTGSFVLGVLGAVALTGLFGMALEAGLLRTLYARDHLSQVLATFALILILNDGVKMVFGTDLPLSAPAALAGPVELFPGFSVPGLPLLILGVGLRSRRALPAGAEDADGCAGPGRRVEPADGNGDGRQHPRALHACLRHRRRALRVAGALLGPLLAVQVGMGENILILAFVVIVIGGIGSIRGALVGSILVGCIDTLGRTGLQQVFREFLPPQWASAAGPAIASIAVYVFMAAVLAFRPQGLFPART